MLVACDGHLTLLGVLQHLHAEFVCQWLIGHAVLCHWDFNALTHNCRAIVSCRSVTAVQLGASYACEQSASH